MKLFFTALLACIVQGRELKEERDLQRVPQSAFNPYPGTGPQAELWLRWNMDEPLITYNEPENMFTLDFPTASDLNENDTGMDENFYDYNCKDDATNTYTEFTFGYPYVTAPDGLGPPQMKMTLPNPNGGNPLPQLKFKVNAQLMSNLQNPATNAPIYEVVTQAMVGVPQPNNPGRRQLLRKRNEEGINEEETKNNDAILPDDGIDAPDSNHQLVNDYNNEEILEAETNYDGVSYENSQDFDIPHAERDLVGAGPTEAPTLCFGKTLKETDVDIAQSTEGQNNLQNGGKLVFEDVGIVRDDPVDLVISVVQGTSYYSQNAGIRNGKKGDFGNINLYTIQGDPESGRGQFRFCFKDKQGVNKRVDSFSMAFYDLDERGSAVRILNIILQILLLKILKRNMN